MDDNRTDGGSCDLRAWMARVPTETDTDSPFQVPEPHVPRPQPTLIDYL